MKNLERLNPKLKIGNDCVLMSVSGVLEVMGRLSYALTYSDFDLIYDLNHFLAFENPKRPEDYVSPSNSLLIPGSIDLVFHDDYSDYIYDYVQATNLFEWEVILHNEYRHDLDLEWEYIQRGLPVFFKCDHYYLYDYYSTQVPDMFHFHTVHHIATLFDINAEKGVCTIADKFYSVFLEIPMAQYIEAKNSTYTSPHLATVHILDSQEPESETIRKFFKTNIQRLLQDTVTIHSRTYQKHTNALRAFMNDFPEFIHKIAELKGDYAPQFISRILRPVRYQKLSYAHLMTYVQGEVREVEELLKPLQEVGDKWFILDKICDKCYLKGDKILNYSDRLFKVLGEIYEMESKIFERLAQIETTL